MQTLTPARRAALAALAVEKQSGAAAQERLAKAGRHCARIVQATGMTVE